MKCVLNVLLLAGFLTLLPAAHGAGARQSTAQPSVNAEPKTTNQASSHDRHHRRHTNSTRRHRHHKSSSKH